MNSAPLADTSISPNVHFRRLDRRLRRRDFVCGESEIDRWTAEAYKQHGKLRSRVWAGYLSGSPTPVSIYGLTIRLESDVDIEGHNGLFRQENKHFAAVHLSHLGVQRALHGQGIGALTMMHALKQFGQVADQTGICALTLVAINADKAGWYEKLGFKRYGQDCQRPKMFFPAKTAIEMISNSSATLAANNDEALADITTEKAC